MKGYLQMDFRDAYLAYRYTDRYFIDITSPDINGYIYVVIKDVNPFTKKIESIVEKEQINKIEDATFATRITSLMNDDFKKYNEDLFDYLQFFMSATRSRGNYGLNYTSSTSTSIT